MQLPLVSIIIPLFNRKDLIKETLESVISQTHSRWECIVVDDGSTDGGPAVVQAYGAADRRIVLVERNVPKKGAPVCRNIGMQKAAGDYLLFLDSDDILAPWALADRLSLAAQHPDFDAWVVQGLSFEKEPGDNASVWFQVKEGRDRKTLDFTAEFLKGNTLWSITGPLWKRRKLVEKRICWDEGLRIWQDANFHKIALLNGFRFYFDFDVLPDYFVRRNSSDIRISSSERDQEMMAHKMKMMGEELAAIEKLGVDVRKRQKLLLQSYIYHIYRFKRDFKVDYSAYLLAALKGSRVVSPLGYFLLGRLFALRSFHSPVHRLLLKLIDLTSIKVWDHSISYKFSHRLTEEEMSLLRCRLKAEECLDHS